MSEGVGVDWMVWNVLGLAWVDLAWWFESRMGWTCLRLGCVYIVYVFWC